MGKYVIEQAKNGIKFNLVAKNGQVICTSQSYNSKAACKKAIASLASVAEKAAIEDQTIKGYKVEKKPKFEVYKDKGGEYRFRLMTANGNNLVWGEGYTEKDKCISGIKSIIGNKDSEIVDKTVAEKKPAAKPAAKKPAAKKPAAKKPAAKKPAAKKPAAKKPAAKKPVAKKAAEKKPAKKPAAKKAPAKKPVAKKAAAKKPAAKKAPAKKPVAKKAPAKKPAAKKPAAKK